MSKLDPLWQNFLDPRMAGWVEPHLVAKTIDKISQNEAHVLVYLLPLKFAESLFAYAIVGQELWYTNNYVD